MKVIISGSSGTMGAVLRQELEKEKDVQIIAGFDGKIADNPLPFKQYMDSSDAPGGADVVIDFSHFSAVPSLMEYCVRTKTPVVVATTALDKDAKNLLIEASRVIPVFKSANMSLGINIVKNLCQTAIPAIEKDFNVEIIEKHHCLKVDSPSGTALLLADAINDVCKVKKNYLYGRHGKTDECRLSDLGIHAVRGGTIPGQHIVMFAGPDEVIEITHTAYSKKVFAQGAIKAARFIQNKEPGYYDMDDLIAESV
jgi:4-hydroxy-tetrahydrodipicolinate reductase